MLSVVLWCGPLLRCAASLAQTNPKKTAILILIVFGTAPGLGDAAVPNEISGKAN